jgi:hypothetical protein
MHVHVTVENLQQWIGVYSAPFDTELAVVKPRYAKWMLDDPRVNIAISTRGHEPGRIARGLLVGLVGRGFAPKFGRPNPIKPPLPAPALPSSDAPI